MRVIAFCNCEVWIWEPDAYLETRFQDGTKVPAAPKPDDVEQAVTAIDLGYGRRIWQMCREHELSHCLLADWLSKPVSPVLWSVAHPGHPDNASLAEQHAEEALVLAWQRYLTTGEIRRELYGLEQETERTFAELRDEARRVMRGEIPSLR